MTWRPGDDENEKEDGGEKRHAAAAAKSVNNGDALQQRLPLPWRREGEKRDGWMMALFIAVVNNE